MADALYRKPGQPFTAAQQAAMYYARKRRRARIAAEPPNAQIGRPLGRLGLQFVVQVQTA